MERINWRKLVMMVGAAFGTAYFTALGSSRGQLESIASGVVAAIWAGVAFFQEAHKPAPPADEV